MRARGDRSISGRLLARSKGLQTPMESIGSRAHCFAPIIFQRTGLTGSGRVEREEAVDKCKKDWIP